MKRVISARYILRSWYAAVCLADDYSPTDEDPPRHELAVVDEPCLDRHPVSVYLGRLSPSSRRTMLAALNAIGNLLSDDRCDAWSLAWEKLRSTATPPPCARCSPTAVTRPRPPIATWPPCAACSRNAGAWATSAPKTFSAPRT